MSDDTNMERLRALADSALGASAEQKAAAAAFGVLLDEVRLLVETGLDHPSMVARRLRGVADHVNGLADRILAGRFLYDEQDLREAIRAAFQGAASDAPLPAQAEAAMLRLAIDQPGEMDSRVACILRDALRDLRAHGTFRFAPPSDAAGRG